MHISAPWSCIVPVRGSQTPAGVLSSHGSASNSSLFATKLGWCRIAPSTLSCLCELRSVLSIPCACGPCARYVPPPRRTQDDSVQIPSFDRLNDQIEAAARRNGWGASEEIRRRLEASFAQKLRAGGDETFRLTEAIRTVAQNLEVPFGSWHKNRFAFDVFAEAVTVLMALYRPPGESLRPADNEIADLYLGTAGTPETAGRMLAGALRRRRTSLCPERPKGAFGAS